MFNMVINDRFEQGIQANCLLYKAILVVLYKEWTIL